MKIIKASNYEEMSKLAAECFMSEIKDNSKVKNIAITAGSTPKRMYEILESLMKEKKDAKVNYFNFDEIPLKGEKEGITMKALRTAFFTPCHINEDSIHIFNEKNYKKYDDVLNQNGGLDMIMIGLGKDGHFCGNLSGTLNSFDEGCRAVSNTLNETLAARIEFLCGGKDKMTDYYVTFGAKTVMHAKHIVMIVSGKDKADILKQVIFGKINPRIPSTVFQLHPNFTLIADEDALSEIDL